MSQKGRIPGKKKPGDPLVFDYRGLPYGKYAVVQIVAFLLIMPVIFAYFQYYSKWRGGFIHHPEAWSKVLGVLVLFLVAVLQSPVRDLLTVRNERVEILGDRLQFYNLFGKKKFDAKLSEIQLMRRGIAITSKVKRYVFVSGKQSFFFSADIGNVGRLLKLLKVPDQIGTV